MYTIYTVKNDDTILTISDKIGITPAEIKALNGFSSNYEVYVGEQIVLPVMEERIFDKYIVKKGDSLYSIAGMFNVSVDNLASLNGLDKGEYIYPDQSIMVPRKNIKFYITKSGDSLETLNNFFERPLTEIVSQNDTIYLLPDQLIKFVDKKVNDIG